MYYVYKITNLVNGKIYIGRSSNIYKRFKKHISDAKRENLLNRRPIPFHTAIMKYGPENFTVEEIGSAETLEEINQLEIYFIDLYNSRDRSVGYNISPGGEGFGSGKDHPQYGTHLSESTKKKLSELNTGLNHPNYGKHLSEKTRDKISQAHKGLKPTDKTRSKLSLSHQGDRNFNYGKPRDLETKLKIGAANSGSKNYFYGKATPNSISVLDTLTGKIYRSKKEAWREIPTTRKGLEEMILEGRIILQ